MDKKNVLMIIVDDLRCDVKSYRRSEFGQHLVTPNFDRFAAESFQFERAYAQQALCGPSRASFLAGRRPSTLKYWSMEPTRDRQVFQGGGKSIPRWLKRHGYVTYGTGKVFHSPGLNRNHFDNFVAHGVELRDGRCGPKPGVGKLRCGSDFSSDDGNFVDYHIANTAIKWFGQLRGNGTVGDQTSSWFMAVGFRRPHMRFRVPKEFQDYYATSPQGLPASFKVPEGVPSYSHNDCTKLTDFEELKQYSVAFDAPGLPVDLIQYVRRGYWSAVSWVDKQVGRVIDGLDGNGFRNNTIVIIFSDHGWQLGEHGTWCKSSNYELATRVPLWVRAPQFGFAGRRVNEIVELIDLFPTIAELSGVVRNPSSIKNLDGSSFVTTMKTEAGKHNIAFSEYPRCYNNSLGSGCTNLNPSQYDVMGYSVRTMRWRYTEWRTWDKQNMHPLTWDDAFLLGRELYDHALDDGTDPNKSENVNLAYRPTKAVERVMHSLAMFLTCEFNQSKCERVDFSKDIDKYESTGHPTKSPSRSFVRLPTATAKNHGLVHDTNWFVFGGGMLTLLLAIIWLVRRTSSSSRFKYQALGQRKTRGKTNDEL